MSRNLRLLIAISLLTFIAFGIYSFENQSAGDESAPSMLTLGWAKVPPTPLTLPTGDPISGSELTHEREFVLVNLWATTCGPCRTEMPELDKLAAGDVVDVVGIARDVDPNRSAEFLERNEIKFPSWWDGNGDFTSIVQEQIRIRGLPSTLLLDDGEVVAVHTGAIEGPASVEDFIHSIDTD